MSFCKKERWSTLSYNFYLAKMSKNDYYEFQKCSSMNEFMEYCDNRKIPYSVDDNSVDISPMEFTEKLYDFGSSLDVDELYKNPTWFYPKALADSYIDYNAIIITEEDLLKIIKQYQQETLDFFNKKLKELKTNDCRKTIECFESKIREIKYKVYINTHKNNHLLTDSWAYEYAIFNLLHIYKTLNQEDVLIFYGR